MTVDLDIANRALQLVGTRTNMSAAEFAAQSSNEAIQAQLIMFKLRDELNRMAPWDFCNRYEPLTYITSVPGTPENPTSGPPLWQRGIPPPPWAYMYQYPEHCFRAIKIIPQYTSQAGGVPIYPPGTSTGGSQVGWSGPALKFKVGNETFFRATGVTVQVGGSGYVPFETITLVQPSYTFTQTLNGVTQSFTMPVGAPARLTVVTVDGSGAVLTAIPFNLIYGEDDIGSPGAVSGSYFSIPANPIAQASTTGVGVGATFNLSFPGSSPLGERVILCNQQQAILNFNALVADVNEMDSLFQDAWVAILAARLGFQLSGDKARANELIGVANSLIMEARKVDGNEGITVNDVTPDFLRIRGNWGGPNWEYTPNMSFDWGSYYSPY